MKLTKKQSLIVLILSIILNIIYRAYTHDWSLIGNSFPIGFLDGLILAILIVSSKHFFKKTELES